MLRVSRAKNWPLRTAMRMATRPMATAVDMEKLKKPLQRMIDRLVEVTASEKFKEELKTGAVSGPAYEEGGPASLSAAGMSEAQYKTVVTAGFCTSLLHKEARVASLLGQGFYTIGPGGEEVLGAASFALEQTDAVALHYRHLATSVVRQLDSGKSLEAVLLDRARGYVVSASDPVTGGRHCALGGGKSDFVVTSTLASQAPPAVGRAMGCQLGHALKLPLRVPKTMVSYVSVGDGSVNNSHFLGAVNLAQYAQHRKFSCPTVFAVSNNDICISLRGYGWLAEFMKGLRMPVHRCDGKDPLAVYSSTAEAVQYARKKKRPVAVVYDKLPRRFGHAATDRQDAYLSAEEITAAAEANPLAQMARQAVDLGVASYDDLYQEYVDLEKKVEAAFQEAANEAKIVSRDALLASNSQPIAPLPKDSVRVSRSSMHLDLATNEASAPFDRAEPKEQQPTVMRKNMNRVMEETLQDFPESVYIGEDVVHGGYYLVTDGLAEKFPHRVRDFPPDETTLVGAAVGYAQVGLLPILEIPYAKYLDCGADMFYEAAISNWLSNGQCPNGMVVRLQGFGRGVFGGNFHTHNNVNLPPGVDVVCYSNGEDYVRGFRNLVQQAKNGRMVMSIDSTYLLNLRHLHERDDAWQRRYPAKGEIMTFDDIVTYGKGKGLALVTYGSGVVMSLQARKELMEKHGWDDVTVIDSPLLSAVPGELRKSIGDYEKVIFVDECKDRQFPFAGIAAELHNEGALPADWRTVAAPNTYNPLGITVSFISVDDIVKAANGLRK
eukprot:CAMPEP_0114614132 /NCGR_PEP_ID=MMETSP0168-20121206/5492_1 /TAXON_ID=95228 ORGANISM="Vannella sp., Strain DIVA3 517/6/12" /NCGR_SAMPLE_ID=MMETSP0168 /ASSEMBLY_ACC=CAM_ASM_000044 /LENGTH=776 /DNA_ID=CAMNT_0001825163 /DNA_START=60 /DNA_END=2390 /DNA_ORIENTATION=-